MLEDQVAFLLQKYLGNYVIGLNKEALKISVWRGDVELTNMQLKPEALNALDLPVKVKAGFLGSVKLKVPWSRLGQDPVLVDLDRIFLIAEPETQVKGLSENAVQEAKKARVREMEMKLLEKAQQVKSEMNKSWLGSLVDTIIGNLKLSISNIHIRYEDLESNPGHPFAAGVTLEKLSAVTIDNDGKEIFATGGALERIQKSVELEQLALYCDSDVSPWRLDKRWEDLQPSEWVHVFKFGTKDGKPADGLSKKHSYILQPVTGTAKYSKKRPDKSASGTQSSQKAAVNLDDVTLCLAKDAYRDMLKLADNFAAFSQRLKYAHYRPLVSVKSNPKHWWKYAFRSISDQIKKASGKLSWEHVLKYARIRKRYISVYATALKSDPNHAVVDDNKEIEELDRELDMELILQWRMLAHTFVDRSIESDLNVKKEKAKKSWWPLGWNGQSVKDESEPLHFSEEDWSQLNNIIGYKESGDDKSLANHGKADMIQTSVDIHMNHNASKLTDEVNNCLAELSCESLDCSIKLYSEAKIFDVKLGSYKLSSPNGLLAESATTYDSLVGVFTYKPFDADVDWSMIAKASPCYMTYLKDSIDGIVNFFKSNTSVSQTIAMEAAAAVQMTIDEVKRTAQQQVNRALKDHSRFLLDLDIAAPKITIPTDFCPDNTHTTKLLLDLGNLMIQTQDDNESGPNEEMDMYLKFNLVLSDVTAFLVDGDYSWSQNLVNAPESISSCSFLPVIDKCGVILKLQQIRVENPSYPSTRIALRLPSLGFHFSPARYHRLMEVVKIFQEGESEKSELQLPWNQADFEGWLFLLSWKGIGSREAVWQRRYVCLVGPFLYILESADSKSYKQYSSLPGKQIHQIQSELVGNVENVLAICEAGKSSNKVIEDANALILRCDSDDSRKTWQSRLQGSIYRASGSAPITNPSVTSSDPEDSETEVVNGHDTVKISNMEKVFIAGVLDELKICFNYNHKHNQTFSNVLLAQESRLFEFRAIGGQVELLMKGKDMFIGTILKTLEIEDLVCRNRVSRSTYLARSLIGSMDEPSSFDYAENQSSGSINRTPSEGDDKFYEAPEDLSDLADCPMTSGKWRQSGKLTLKAPSFERIPGVLPDDALKSKIEDDEPVESFNSFVKAQIIIYDQASPLYNNIDKRVVVTLATLSFFCRRPTILAIMEFVNAINTKDETCESFSDTSSVDTTKGDTPAEDVVDSQQLTVAEEPALKGLLGKGKSRTIFNLTLNMARAQILLMNEDETRLAKLSQDNLLADIKVYPSSFSIKAALGNLRVSDDSLPISHMYYWACDMRNPGGSSFVELVFSSYGVDDEDYKGYEFSLFGQLSEVRVVYLNRFIQEVINYFMGLVPNNSSGVVKLKDQVSNSEKWFTTSEIEGSPSIKLDLSLRKPIILMPRNTGSLDYLQLDVVHITVQNTFQWLHGSKSELNAVHVDILTVMVEDINLNVGTGTELGESIIHDVNGVSVVIRRSLRDLLHQLPNTEITITIEALKAALSNKEYQIITECALSNFSESPKTIPPMNLAPATSPSGAVEPHVPQDNDTTDNETQNVEIWINMKVSVVVNLVELSLHSGSARDASLATLQISGVWLLYKANTLGEGFLSATLKGFTVIDDREGTEEEFRLAIGKPESIGSSNPRLHNYGNENQRMNDMMKGSDVKPIPTMLILDAKFGQKLTSVSVCIQRPQLLVALDFLLAVVEFFVPTVGNMLSNQEDESATHVVDAIILDKSVYYQPSVEVYLSPRKPLIADDERFDHFIYDGKGGTLYLQDRQGLSLSDPSTEAIFFVGSKKRLQFRNVVIKNGEYLDSCILLGAESCYSASEDDQVYLEMEDKGPPLNVSGDTTSAVPSPNVSADKPKEIVVEIQAIGPELTFYNMSKDVGESMVLSNKLLHAQLDAFCRLVMREDTIEMSANALGLTMESNGIRILEPFDTSINFSNASGKTNINVAVSNIFMNFSFSILRLFLAVQEDILAFLRRASQKMTTVCSQFDRVGTIKSPYTDQIYAFWRPKAPPGFTVLGDYLTPLDKPPSKGVVAVNTNYVRVKRPSSFKLIWPPEETLDSQTVKDDNQLLGNQATSGCSVWFPEAPKGYVALGCIVSQGRAQPPLSSAFCISASLVSPCALRDCITIKCGDMHPSSLAFWRVDNSVGTFVPADFTTLSLTAKSYDLRHVLLGISEPSFRASKISDLKTGPSSRSQNGQSAEAVAINSGRRFEAVASFRLIWWNHGSSSRKKLSIWRPVVPQGMIYFGDVAVQGYEPPNTCIVLQDNGDDELYKAPLDFQLVGQIKKQRGVENISLWMPQAPPGFVSLGCIASKVPPKQSDFSLLKCIRSDMVTADQFLEESVWDTSGSIFRTEPFSIWTVGNELGTFIVRSGFKKPPKRYAMKLADTNAPAGSDDTVIVAEIGTFSAALFDDYGGLMVPLFNISLSSIGFSFHGRQDHLNSTVSFSLSARSYNDKYEDWEPLIEPVDGFVRYLYDLNAPGATSQLRITSTRDLNLNVTVSNANMLFQAYASWNNLSHAHESMRRRDAVSPSQGVKSIVDIHHRKNYFIIPQNKLGQDIFIRATEARGLSNIQRMPAGETKAVKVPVSKDMLDSHLKGELCQKRRILVTVIISEAQLPRVEGLCLQQYTVAVRLTQNQADSNELLHYQQSVRTCGRISHGPSSDIILVRWNEIFFFKVDTLDSYMLELIVTDIGRGEPVGFFSGPLKQITESILDSSHSFDSNELAWKELSSEASMRMTRSDKSEKTCGRIRCAVLSGTKSDTENSKQSHYADRKSGLIQISPSKEGPWTTVRLNYAAPAACWRLGNDVVASEVSVKDGNRYVNIRSLVSVCNTTNFTLEVCLKLKGSRESIRSFTDADKVEGLEFDDQKVETDDFFETEKYDPTMGWVGFSDKPKEEHFEGGASRQESSGVQLPSDWYWVTDWHLDKTSVDTDDGWIYAPDMESLNRPETCNSLKSTNYARRRRWIRDRKRILDGVNQQICVGQLKPGDMIPIPLSGLSHSGSYALKLRPLNFDDCNEYSWSSVVDKPGLSQDSANDEKYSEICVSSLTESEELLCCTKMSGTSSNGSNGFWFCLSIQATEIAKDIHSDPIQDWSLVVKSPLSIINFLPLAAEYSILERQASGHFVDCIRGVFSPEESVKVYNADIRKPLYLSLLPQRGWLPIHEAVLISDPGRVPAKTISLRSSISGRIVQIILEQNLDKERPILTKIIRVYAQYWFSIARCPPLTFRLVDLSGTKNTRKITSPFRSRKPTETIFEEITEEEIYDGYTIDSTLNFKMLGLTVSITQSSQEKFGAVKDLSPLGDMDGSLDLNAYDDDSNCMRLFISSKPCPYHSVPTKVISVRPFMTFTNRAGQNIFLKLSSEDEPKVLRATDSRVSFVYRETEGTDKLQVRLEDTEWSFPVQIVKEDTISLVLRKQDGTRKYLRTEIRGYEEGSRFIIVFRVGSVNGPIRIENRTMRKTISIRQSGFGDDAWIQLTPLHTTIFSWEDPYGQKSIDAKVNRGNSVQVWKLNLENAGLCAVERALELQFDVVERKDFKVARFTDDKVSGLISDEEISSLTPATNCENPSSQGKAPSDAAPLEIIIELGVVGVSIVDHRPKELAYLYFERVFISYSSGYDGGATSRFKLILGHLQLDNQLALTIMPVLLAPEQALDMNHPVFKMTITMRNENADGIQVYPYVYIRVTERCWRVNIHEPIIWALVDFFDNLQLDRIPDSSDVTQVDPEIRVDLIDVSEVRLKVSFETAPAQRPNGVLGVWSPILSAVGNAFKIQVHLRKVMHTDRFMRKSSVVPAIGNRIWRDLIHNPLHLIFSVDVLGMTSSTLASLSKGFAELSTDGQFLKLRSKQGWSRRITGVGDGFIQGTEALAQGFAFGVSGVVRKPMESARQNGLLGLAHGLGRAFVGIIVQPMSGALDFFSLTVDGIGASCSRCLEVFTHKSAFQRIRNPRAIRADGILREYSEREAVGQTILYLAETSRNLGCTELFKEPSKFAWSDYYEEHFVVPYQRIVVITNKRVMLLQCPAPDNMDKRPCKILWDVPWEELLALELAKAGGERPSHLILHLKTFRKSEIFVRVIKCNVEDESVGRETQAVKICFVVRKMWRAYQADSKSLILKVPSSQRHVYFAWSDSDGVDLPVKHKSFIKLRELSSSSKSSSGDRKFVKHSINFIKIWSSKRESKGRCKLCQKQVLDDSGLCSIWRPVLPEGYVSIGDIAHVGDHPPNVAAVYRNSETLFALPVGYDLVWRNCSDDYKNPVSIWHPRAPEGFVSPGCVAMASFEEPKPDLVYCVAESLAVEAVFEDQKLWSSLDSYPWACHVYQVQSEALHFVALRQTKEDSEWKPMRVLDDPNHPLLSTEAQ